MIHNLVIAPDILEKIKRKHNVNAGEVHECFMNLDGPHIEDTRAEHATNPPTEWFVAQTDRGRLLKVIFVFKNGNLYLKSAYEANEKTLHIYTTRCKS